MPDFFSGPPPRLDLDPVYRAGPKYLRIVQYLSDAVETGRLAGNEVLPSQRELADYFGVTLMTVRQGLNMLADQGLLRVEHGRGTFVARRAHELPVDGLTSFVNQLRDEGRTLVDEVLWAREIGAPPGVSTRLKLRGEVVFCIARLRRVDGDPLVYSQSLLDPELGRKLDLDNVVAVSLYSELASSHGVIAASAVETFRADLLTDDQAAALGRQPGAAALISSRVTYSSRGLPVIDDRAVMPGEGVQVSTRRRVEDSDLRFHLPLDGTVSLQSKKGKIA
ncbi:MAG: GntR family transcriptional regulator [Actinomycetota bacterium]|nr:GntR family transcriptional regulator [Actinomycetota bacterium]